MKVKTRGKKTAKRLVAFGGWEPRVEKAEQKTAFFFNLSYI